MTSANTDDAQHRRERNPRQQPSDHRLRDRYREQKQARTDRLPQMVDGEIVVFAI